MDKENIAYPSLRTVSYLSNCSINTVRKEISILIEHGWLKIDGREILKGKYGNNRYLIMQRDLIRGTKSPSFMSKPISNTDTGT